MLSILRGLGSTKVGGTLRCPTCQSNKIKRIDTIGFDTDLYQCQAAVMDIRGFKRKCHQRFRYLFRPMETGIDPKDGKNRPEIILGKYGAVPMLGRIAKIARARDERRKMMMGEKKLIVIPKTVG